MSVTLPTVFNQLPQSAQKAARKALREALSHTQNLGTDTGADAVLEAIWNEIVQTLKELEIMEEINRNKKLPT